MVLDGGGADSDDDSVVDHIDADDSDCADDDDMVGYGSVRGTHWGVILFREVGNELVGVSEASSFLNLLTSS